MHTTRGTTRPWYMYSGISLSEHTLDAVALSTTARSNEADASVSVRPPLILLRVHSTVNIVVCVCVCLMCSSRRRIFVLIVGELNSFMNWKPSAPFNSAWRNIGRHSDGCIRFVSTTRAFLATASAVPSVLSRTRMETVVSSVTVMLRQCFTMTMTTIRGFCATFSFSFSVRLLPIRFV